MLQSMELQRVRYNPVTERQQQQTAVLEVMEIKVLLLRIDHVPNTKNLNDTMLANFHSNPMDLQHPFILSTTLKAMKQHIPFGFCL